MARTPGQSFVGLELSDELLALLDEARRAKGLSRSQYIRFAITAALESDGAALSTNLALAPDRAGKGGRPTHRKPRADSVLRNLPRPIYAELMRLLVDGMGYEDAKSWLKKEHNVDTNVASLGEFWKTDVADFKLNCQKAMQDSLSDALTGESKPDTHKPKKPSPRTTSSSSPGETKRKGRAA